MKLHHLYIIENPEILKKDLEEHQKTGSDIKWEVWSHNRDRSSRQIVYANNIRRLKFEIKSLISTGKLHKDEDGLYYIKLTDSNNIDLLTLDRQTTDRYSNWGEWGKIS